MAQTGRPCHRRHFCWAALVWTARAGHRNQGRPPHGRQAPWQLGLRAQHLRQCLAHSRGPAEPQISLEVGPEGGGPQSLQRRVAPWDLDPVLALCKEKPSTQTLIRNLPALEHWLKKGYSPGLAREMCPWAYVTMTHMCLGRASAPPGTSGRTTGGRSQLHVPPLNMCSAQKQCTQAPGDINILIPVPHTDEGSRCHCPRMLTTEDESLLRESRTGENE